MDASLAVLRKTGSQLELVFLKDFSIERQIQLELMLDIGEYIVLPRTTGCLLGQLNPLEGKSSRHKAGPVPLMIQAKPVYHTTLRRKTGEIVEKDLKDVKKKGSDTEVFGIARQ